MIIITSPVCSSFMAQNKNLNSKPSVLCPFRQGCSNQYQLRVTGNKSICLKLIKCIKEADEATVTSPIGFWITVLTRVFTWFEHFGHNKLFFGGKKWPILDERVELGRIEGWKRITLRQYTSTWKKGSKFKDENRDNTQKPVKGYLTVDSAMDVQCYTYTPTEWLEINQEVGSSSNKLTWNLTFFATSGVVPRMKV